ncbi:MAG TPA: hypothetical protein VND65_02610 [Candidatus Binatia bacterium]|nr:hypothetical protein [Candidatus Binatia bacterium]
MQRLTARWLLLIVLLGAVAPLVAAMNAPLPHACCRRNSAHSCHQAAALSDNDQLSFSRGGCCDPACGRAATTAQWRHVRVSESAGLYQKSDFYPAASQPAVPQTASANFQSPRAPPFC